MAKITYAEADYQFGDGLEKPFTFAIASKLNGVVWGRISGSVQRNMADIIRTSFTACDSDKKQIQSRDIIFKIGTEIIAHYIYESQELRAVIQCPYAFRKQIWHEWMLSHPLRE
jgi:hypothetical protein